MGNSKKLPVKISNNQPNRLYGNFNEAPVIKQSVDAFEMSTTEITNKMYEQYGTRFISNIPQTPRLNPAEAFISLFKK